MKCRIQRTRKSAFENMWKNTGETAGLFTVPQEKAWMSCICIWKSAGFQVGRYHAGMGAEARRTSQEDFIYDRIKVMIATNAFGMGIDKSNVRFVTALQYASEHGKLLSGGRPGRDVTGEAAECILYYSPQDAVINRFLLESKDNYREYTGEELRMIQARDMERLRKMEAYCTTTKCLRHSILNYFGGRVGRKMRPIAPTVWKNLKRWMLLRRQQM